MPTKRLAGNLLPKDPMDVINKSNRLEKTLQHLKKDADTKHLSNDKIKILLYSGKKEKIIEKCTLGSNLLSEKRKKYYEQLPVVKIEKIYENHMRKATRNSKSVCVTTLEGVEITIKFLPEAYVESELYQLGYINDLIYDHICSKDTDQPGETVIGSESFDLIMKHMINTRGKSDINSMEKIFKDICGCNVKIRQTDFCRNKHPEYYVIEKCLRKKEIN